MVRAHKPLTVSASSTPQTGSTPSSASPVRSADTGPQLPPQVVRQSSCHLDLALSAAGAEKEAADARSAWDIARASLAGLVTLAYATLVAVDQGLDATGSARNYVGPAMRKGELVLSAAVLVDLALQQARPAAAGRAAHATQVALAALALLLCVETALGVPCLSLLPRPAAAMLRFAARGARAPVAFAHAHRRATHLATRRSLRRTGEGTPVERAVEILRGLQHHPHVEPRARDEVAWVADLITSRDLYGFGFGSSLAPHAHAMSAEMRAYLIAEGVPHAAGVAGGRPAAAPRPLATVSSLPRRLLSGAAGKKRDVSPGPPPPHLSAFGHVEALPEVRLFDDWESFNIFRVYQATQGQPILGVGYYLFHRFGLMRQFLIDEERLIAFLATIERAYRRAPQYHNCIHAAETLATMGFFLLQAPLARSATPLEVLGTILAALIHDADHPGYNNKFLCDTEDPLAIRYNDVSVLENHHLAVAWGVLRREECNILATLTRREYGDVRELMVNCVLQTDMSRHFEATNMFAAKMIGSNFCLDDADDRRFLLPLAVHAADVAAVMRPPGVCVPFAVRLSFEFFAQGDEERSRGMAVSKMMDRRSTSLAAMQTSFIRLIVLPLFEPLMRLLGREELTMRLKDNLAAILDRGDAFYADLSDEQRTSVYLRMDEAGQLTAEPLPPPTAAAGAPAAREPLVWGEGDQLVQLLRCIRRAHEGSSRRDRDELRARVETALRSPRDRRSSLDRADRRSSMERSSGIDTIASQDVADLSAFEPPTSSQVAAGGPGVDALAALRARQARWSDSIVDTPTAMAQLLNGSDVVAPADPLPPAIYDPLARKGDEPCIAIALEAAHARLQLRRVQGLPALADLLSAVRTSDLVAANNVSHRFVSAQREPVRALFVHRNQIPEEDGLRDFFVQADQ